MFRVVVYRSKILNLKANHNVFLIHGRTSYVVVYRSKILNLKANHNRQQRLKKPPAVVVYRSKILNLKANHNDRGDSAQLQRVVVYRSKILNLKANHNEISMKRRRGPRCCLSVKDTKSESKSQLRLFCVFLPDRCCLSVKDTKSESKSQRAICTHLHHSVVVYRSKILNLKANHNGIKMQDWRL